MVFFPPRENEKETKVVQKGKENVFNCKMSSKARLGLLTYKPQLSRNPPVTSSLYVPGSSGATPATSSATTSSSTAVAPRFWARPAHATCVAGMFRHSRLLTEYVASYKFHDPDWRPLLSLPCGDPVGLEMRARHCNAALKHIVQKGHALYLITHTQHSVFEPRGVVQQTHVTCSFGVRGERLRTMLVHEGPLRAEDLEGPRGVLAVSQVEGYGTWFERKPMLWQRSRRVGAMQAHMGAFEWELCDASLAGKRGKESEIMLLGGEGNLKMFNGALAVNGIVSSLRIAEHPYLYVNDFEAPAVAVTEALSQAAYCSAATNGLVKHSSSERLHAVAWSTRTAPPYVPIECDFPFRVQLARPTVFTTHDNYPSTLIGHPALGGAPVLHFDYNVRQGVEHYVYDDAPSSRPLKWWSQKDTEPFAGSMYFAREGVLDQLSLRNRALNGGSLLVSNPFDAATRNKKKIPGGSIAPSSKVMERVARYRAKSNKKRKTSTKAAAATERDPAATTMTTTEQPTSTSLAAEEIITNTKPE